MRIARERPRFPQRGFSILTQFTAEIRAIRCESTVSFKERTDVTAVPAMGVVAETMVALVLADAMLDNVVLKDLLGKN